MEQIFEKINALFCEYLKAVSLDNTENARLAIEQKIIGMVWQSNKNYREYSVEVVEKVKESLKYFSKSDACKNGGNFSNYLYFSISAAIKDTKSKESLEGNNGGISMPDNVVKDIKKIRNLKKMFPDMDDVEFILKVSEILKMKDSKIKHLLAVMNSSTCGIEIKNQKTGDVVFLPDILETSNADPLFKEVANQEMTNSESLLSLIEKAWKKKPDPMLSELLTIKVLDANLNVENMENYIH